MNLKAPTVTENRRDDKYVLGKLRSKSGRNALSLLFYSVLILYIIPHLSEVQNFQLDCVEVDLQEKKILVHFTINGLSRHCFAGASHGGHFVAELDQSLSIQCLIDLLSLYVCFPNERLMGIYPFVVSKI